MLQTFKVDYDPTDVRFWFNQLEMRMQLAGVKSQWTKRLLLQGQLPYNIVADMKDIFSLQQDEAGDKPYKTAKDRMFKLYVQRDVERYRTARDLTLTGKPSSLAKRIISLICDKQPPLTGCCCEKVVEGIWKELLPNHVRLAVATLSLAPDKLEATLDTADAVSDALGAAPVAATAVAAAAAPKVADEVAALRTNQPRNRGGARRGGGHSRRGGSAPAPGTRGRGRRHPDDPPEGACDKHWKFGRSAYHCDNPDKCPWKDYTVKPPRN